MAKIPGAPDLGYVRPEAARPTGAIDATPIARGAQAIAEGVAKLGAGVAKAGEGLGELGQDESRFQYAKAQSDFITRKIDLDAETGQATDYGPDGAGKTLPQRYAEKVNGLRDSAATMIQDPTMRDLFVTHTSVTVEQGIVAAQQHARSLSNDAQVAYVGQMGDKAINQAVATPGDETRAQLIDSHNMLIDGLARTGAISQERALAMKRDWAHQYATADILARSKDDPQGVINELRAAPGSPEAIDNRIAQVEGRTKNAKSSADGVGQFVDPTWLDLVKRYRPDLAKGRSDADILLLRKDENLGREMLANYRQENTAYLQKQGLEASPGNIYLAHFLGPAGAAAVLKANPTLPVQDALANAVGPDKAKAMVEANPTVLQGRLAGSVKEWADGKMGGVGPGGSRLVDMLNPAVREQLLAQAQTQLQKQNVQGLADFKARIEDSQAEATRTGNVQQPIGQGEFIARLGGDLGPKAFRDYQANIQVARDAARVATLNPQEMQDLLRTYDPKPGDGYAAAAERQDVLRKAIAQSIKERTDDPAGYAVKRLPGSGDAYKAWQAAQSDPTMSEGERQYAARKYAATAMLEQQQAGIPAYGRQILPSADVDRFKDMVTKAADSDDPTARLRLIQTIQAEKAQWGDYWPAVMQQLAPTMRPVVRAIAAGADADAMTRLLSVPKGEDPVKILKEQSETKASDLTRNLNTAMQPFMASLVGRQKDADYPGYYDLASKLAALYVRDGVEASTAATRAFNALIGNRYDFRDTFRVPKDPAASWTADQVQAGAQAARTRLQQLGARPAVDDVGLADNPADSMSAFRRDGVWVTEPGNRGLNLAVLDRNGNQRFVRGADGEPLMLNWATLAKLGDEAPVQPDDLQSAALP